MAATIPVVARKTLLEWIDDDGNAPANTAPACSAAVQNLHARIAIARDSNAQEPLQPPPGLRLAPLG